MKLRTGCRVIGLVGFLYFVCPYVRAVNIGGDGTNIARLNVVQSVAAGDIIQNGGILAAGFTMVSGPASFLDQFAVSGIVGLNGQTLVLGSNFNLGDNTTNVNTLGNIVGAGNAFELSRSATLFPVLSSGATYTFSDLTLIINENTVLNNSALLFTGNGSIDGGGLVFDLAGTSSIVVDANSSLLLKRVTLANIHGNMLRCLDNTGTISCCDVEILLDGDMSFEQGQLYIDDVLHLQGSYVFSYKTSQTSLIGDRGNLIIDHGVTFSYDPLGNASDLLQLVTSNAQITLNGGLLHATSGGLQLVKGLMVVNGRSYISNEAINDATAIILGDGVSVANNVTLRENGNIEILGGRVIFNDA